MEVGYLVFKVVPNQELVLCVMNVIYTILEEMENILKIMENACNVKTWT